MVSLVAAPLCMCMYDSRNVMAKCQTVESGLGRQICQVWSDLSMPWFITARGQATRAELICPGIMSADDLAKGFPVLGDSVLQFWKCEIRQSKACRTGQPEMFSKLPSSLTSRSNSSLPRFPDAKWIWP